MDKDIFNWVQRVGYPPELLNNSMKKTLCEGLCGLLWEEMSKAIFSANEVTKIRKNILLYKLQNNKADVPIQCTKDIAELNAKTSQLDSKISMLEQQCEEKNFLLRQKIVHLRKLRSDRETITIKKELLKMKRNEAQGQINDCANMRLVCKKLMPNTINSINKQVLKDCLGKIAALDFEANTREVWDDISNILGPIQTSTIWACLFECQSEDLTKLTKLNMFNEVENTNIMGENIEIGIARACGQHIYMVSKKLLHNAKTAVHQQHLIETIDDIEMAASNASDVSEWLALALEVRKLEVEQNKLQDDIDNIKSTLADEDNCAFSLAELTSDIRQIDVETEKYAQDIKESLLRLKSASLQIMAQRDKLSCELQKICALSTNGHNMDWLNIRLNTELNIFHNVLNINALRKVMLKGEVGSCRHVSFCFNEASIPVVDSDNSMIMAHFPIIQIPIYTLIHCYKELVTNIIYKRLENVKPKDTELSILSVSGQEDINANIVELLNATKTSCRNAEEEIQQFDKILKSWATQDVQKVMDIMEEKVVHGATFKEWLQRYHLLVYMIEKSK